MFAPDRHLGAFVAKQADRPDLVLWQGTCIVHETFSEKRLLELMAQHPDAEVIAHPECHEASCATPRSSPRRAASSSARARAAKQTFIVATEAGILHKMQRPRPASSSIAAPPEDESCACNVCPHMKRNTLEKLYLCLRDLAPQVDVPEADARQGAAADPAHARDEREVDRHRRGCARMQSPHGQARRSPPPRRSS